MTYDTINDAQTIAGGGEGAILAGRYRIIRQLGSGGMGSVYLAEDTQLDNKPFAIKMLPSILVSNKRAYRQLKDEALVAMQLVHPNIVQVRAFEENDGNPFLVMDYIDGQTLDDYLAEHFPADATPADVARPPRPCCKGEGALATSPGTTGVPPVVLSLPEAEVIRILKPIAAALDYAHGEGVVHRDVKPANVMIRKDGHPFILDFGIAREIQETMTRVTGKQTSGTLRYMSPEQLMGAQPKPAQDVYSFAAMVYECLKGEPPFSHGQIDYQIVHEPPPPLADAGTMGRLPVGVNGQAVRSTRIAASVMAGLAKKPEDRPPTCAAVLEGDKGVSRRGAGAQRGENGSGTVERGDPTAPETDTAGRAGAPRTPQGGSRFGAAMTALAVALVLVGGYFGWMKYDEGVKSREAETIRQKATEEAKRKAEEEARQKAVAEATRKAVEEAQQKAAAEEAKRKAEEATRQRVAAEEAKRKAEEAARQKAAAEEAERKAEEARQKAAAEEAARQKAAAEEATRKAEEAELNFLKTRIKVKVSDAEKKMKLIEEFRADPDGLGEHISTADAQWKVISAIGTPTALEAARGAFDSADKAEEQIAHELEWLQTNKASRDAARAAWLKEKANEKKKANENIVLPKKPNKVQLWAGGPYWADRNIGAETPEDYGDYFWWGDTVGYKNDGPSYDFSFGLRNTRTHNKIPSTLTSEGWITAVDKVLTPEHDAAHKHWGGGWRMPTRQEWDDLRSECDWTWTTMNGVDGYVVRGRGNYASHSIFLPAAGYGKGSSLIDDDSYGYYWSSVPCSDSYNAWCLYFHSSGHKTSYYDRYGGRSVRPVQGVAK